MSDGFSRQVAAELSADHPAASVSARHLPPYHTGLVGFAAGRHRVPVRSEKNVKLKLARLKPSFSTLTGNRKLERSLLGLVDVGAAFAEVEVDLVSGVAALQLQQRRVLTLVPQAAFVAGEDGLTPKSTHTHAHTQSVQTQTRLQQCVCVSDELLIYDSSRNFYFTLI